MIISHFQALVAPAGFEPALAVYEAAVLPLERKSIMVPAKGVEPLILAAAGLKPDVYSNSTTQTCCETPRSRFREALTGCAFPVILGDPCGI